MNNIDNEIGLNEARDLMDETLYVNALHAIWRVEADCGGLDSIEVWRETEWLREEMLKTKRPNRQHMVEQFYLLLKKKYADRTKNEDKSVMCIMMLFANRLITANKEQSLNPNREIIRRIVRVLCSKMKEDADLKRTMAIMLAEMDKAGTENEKGGRMIPWELDILADAPEWSNKLKAIFQTYAKKAEPLIKNELYDSFLTLWNELTEDSLFAAEMRTSTLGKDFNLQLLFNVYGLLYPKFYNSKARGIATIAKKVGEKPEVIGNNNYYSRGYFTPHEIERFKHAIKSQQLLEHIKQIIQKHYTHKSV